MKRKSAKKHNKGRTVTGQWIFEDIDRTTKEIFMEPIDNQTSNILLEVIKRKIADDNYILIVGDHTIV